VHRAAHIANTSTHADDCFYQDQRKSQQSQRTHIFCKAVNRAAALLTARSAALTTHKSPPCAVRANKLQAPYSRRVHAPACKLIPKNKTRGGSIQLDCVPQESKKLPRSSAAQPARACSCMQINSLKQNTRGKHTITCHKRARSYPAQAPLNRRVHVPACKLNLKHKGGACSWCACCCGNKPLPPSSAAQPARACSYMQVNSRNKKGEHTDGLRAARNATFSKCQSRALHKGSGCYPQSVEAAASMVAVITERKSVHVSENTQRRQGSS
jgi:hypothetical protein